MSRKIIPSFSLIVERTYPYVGSILVGILEYFDDSCIRMDTSSFIFGYTVLFLLLIMSHMRLPSREDCDKGILTSGAYDDTLFYYREAYIYFSVSLSYFFLFYFCNVFSSTDLIQTVLIIGAFLIMFRAACLGIRISSISRREK